MPRVGGVYSLPPGYFATDGTTIDVSQHNPPLEDIAQALTDSLPRDGSAPMTGGLNMGTTNKITNLAAATNPADAVRFDQISDPTAIVLAQMKLFGLSVTGNAPTLANIDSTTTASGQYRFLTGSSGTYPTGVVATDTGQIIMIRETVNEGSMTMDVGAGRRFWRALVAGVWDAWQEILMVPASTSTGILVRNAAGTATVRQITSSDSSVAITNPAGVAGDINLTTVSPIKCWGNMNGSPSTGTYSRTGTTVTVSMTSHGMTTGQQAKLDFTTGTATDGFYTVTVSDANTYTVTDAASGSTSGNVTRQLWVRAGMNITDITDEGGLGQYLVKMTALSDANFAVFCNGNQANDDTGGSRNDFYSGRPVSSSTFRIFAYDVSGTAVDPAVMMFQVVR